MVTGFTYKNKDGVGFYTIDEFEKLPGVKTCFSTRIGGVSQGNFKSLNPGYKSGDDRSCVEKNISMLCRSAGFKIEDLVFSDQVHKDVCRIVGREDRGKGTVRESDIIGVDALITNEKNVAICIFTADCVPVFLLDTVNKVIALCHAGWRGVTGKIVPKAIGIMKETYRSLPQNIHAFIGPSIGPCCFYVGPEVVGEFNLVFDDTSDIVIKDEGKYRINLWNAVFNQLKAEGIDGKSILNSEACTSCRPEEFYSYRRDGSKTGRMISILQLT